MEQDRPIERGDREPEGQFEAIVAWVRRQHGAVRQVQDDQASAAQLVDDAELELRELRRTLAGVEPLGDVRSGLFAKK